MMQVTLDPQALAANFTSDLQVGARRPVAVRSCTCSCYHASRWAAPPACVACVVCFRACGFSYLFLDMFDAAG